jgi:lipoprotein-releasing system ATP-binding protein
MHPDAGRAEIAGEDLYELSDLHRARVRNRRVGFVFQMHHLLPEFSALENVMLPALIAGVHESSARQRAAQLLDTMALSERAAHKPGELSGGEQQRVAVARALVNDPEIVLADEPSGNLDKEASLALHALLERLSRERHQAFVVATHSPSLARSTQRALVLTSGELSPIDKTEEWL